MLVRFAYFSTAMPSTKKTTPPSTERLVSCPGCHGPSVYSPANPYRPFCSQRCKLIDMGAWAAEEFRVPSEAPPEDELYGDPKRSNPDLLH